MCVYNNFMFVWQQFQLQRVTEFLWGYGLVVFFWFLDMSIFSVLFQDNIGAHDVWELPFFFFYFSSDLILNWMSEVNFKLDIWSQRHLKLLSQFNSNFFW